MASDFDYATAFGLSDILDLVEDETSGLSLPLDDVCVRVPVPALLDEEGESIFAHVPEPERLRSLRVWEETHLPGVAEGVHTALTLQEVTNDALAAIARGDVGDDEPEEEEANEEEAGES